MSCIRWLAVFALVVLAAGPITATLAQEAPATGPSTAPATGSLTVTVTDEDGKPIQGASVTVSAARARHSAAKSGDRPTTRPTRIAHGKTNADGIVILDNIPSGRLNVSAHLGKSRGRQRIELQEGESAKVTIQLVDPSAN